MKHTCFQMEKNLLVSIISLKSYESVRSVMLVRHVTPGTEVIVVTYFAFPPHTYYTFFSARIAGNSRVMHT